MSSYHSSFTYLGQNSAKDKNLIIASFEPDNGFKDTFLSMEQVQDDYYDGTKKIDYGARYNNTASIEITMIKNNGEDFSMAEFRSIARWLTGSKTNSWLELYNSGDEPDYYFLGRITDFQQYKLDGRTVGVMATFSSVTPWAFSAEQHFDCEFGQQLSLTEDHILYAGAIDASTLYVDENGILYSGPSSGNYFSFLRDGVIFIDNTAVINIDNQSDDLYTYIYLDMTLNNKDCDYLTIKNLTLEEETHIENMSKNENITLSAKQFIVSDIPNKIFGDDFNFVWPRLAPGENDITITGSGSGNVKFSYRYPMKVGDCTMDVDVSSGNICCGDNNGGGSGGGTEFTGTIAWRNVTDTPTTIAGYRITDAYTKQEVDSKTVNVDIDEKELNDMLSETFS